MNESRAYIERIRRVNPHYLHLQIALDDPALRAIKPGQSLLARRLDPDDPHRELWHPYLREQWWLAGFTAEGLLLVERPFSKRYHPQQEYSILGPVGQPYRFRKSLRNVLLVAYDTAPLPLTVMIGQLLHNHVSVTLVLLGQARAYTTSHLAPEVEIVHGTSELEWAEQVMTLGWADQIFVVVNQDDEWAHFGRFFNKVQQLRNDVPKNYIFGVFQPLLPCGVGACAACLLRVNGDLQASCTKGPTFDLTQLKLPSESR